MADVRNVIVEDWTMWGIRFEADSSGNIVNSLFSARSVRALGRRQGELRAPPEHVAARVRDGQRLPGAGRRRARRETRARRIPAPPVTTLSVAEMVPRVRTRAGCLPRDAVDQAYIDAQDGWDVTGTEPLRIGPGS